MFNTVNSINMVEKSINILVFEVEKVPQSLKIL